MKKLVTLTLLLLSIFAVVLTTQTYAFNESIWTLNNGYYYYKGFELYRDDQTNKTVILTPQENQFIEYKNISNQSGWQNTGFKNAKLIVTTQPGAAATRVWDIYLVELDSNNQEISERIYIAYASSDTYVGVPLKNFVQIRFKQFESPETEYDTVESLASTTGNPFSNSGTMGVVHSSLDGYNLKLQITYNDEVRYLKMALASNTDLTPFKANNAVYFTYQNVKYIAFSHDSTKSMLNPNQDLDEFIPYTVLNLDTNEIKTYDSLSVYIHLKSDERLDLYGYFYIDQYVIDKLLSATVAFTWRYENWLFNSSWQTSTVTVNHGQTSESRTHWWFKFLSIFEMKQNQIYYMHQNTKLFDFPVNEIQKVVWQREILIGKNELELAYRKSADKYGYDFDSIKDTLDVYKLYLGNYSNPLAQKIGVDENSVNVINVVYTKDGYLQTIKAEDINTIPSLDDFVKPEKSLIDKLFDVIRDDLTLNIVIWTLVIIVFSLIVLPILTKVLNNIKEFLGIKKRRRRW